MTRARFIAITKIAVHAALLVVWVYLMLAYIWPWYIKWAVNR
jgi:hypothetical protein